MKQPVLLIATHNPAKVQELQALLLPHGFSVCSLADIGIQQVVEETAPTFIGNAQLKAETYARLSGLPTLADDGGLEIDALQGQPGVHSSRCAGPHATDEEKVAYILAHMAAIPPEQRGAYFTTIIALAQPGKPTRSYQGQLKGIITTSPRGRLVKGFPYRQIFLLPTYQKTMAELDEQRIAYQSHRHQALDALLADLKRTELAAK